MLWGQVKGLQRLVGIIVGKILAPGKEAAAAKYYPGGSPVPFADSRAWQRVGLSTQVLIYNAGTSWLKKVNMLDLNILQ